MAMQVEHCFHCAHHTMESDRDRSLRTVLLANEIRKRKRQTPLEVVAPLHVFQQQQQQQQVYLPPMATLVVQPQLQHHLVVVDPASVVINNTTTTKRRRVTVTMAEVQPSATAAPQRVREEKERAKRSERRVRITMKQQQQKQVVVGTAAAPIVVADDDEEVLASGHIAAAVREVAAQRETEQQQRLKNVIAAGLLHNPVDRPLGAATPTAAATTATTTVEPHVYDLYFSKESLGAIVNLVSEWIRQYDPSSYANFSKEEREKWIISLVQMIVQILNWRLNNFFSSYAQCFKIESFPNLFSKNFKADTSRVGVDKLAKKWQKRNYELLLATLMYADRYVRARGIKDVPLFHLLAVSSLCTIKHWLEERNRHANRLFADVLGLTVQQVNALERTFLAGLDYSLSLAPEDFPHFLLAQIQRSAAAKRL